MKLLLIVLAIQALSGWSVSAFEQCQPYELSSGIDRELGVELVYEVSFPSSCNAPEMQQSIYQYSDDLASNSDVLLVNRGLRCARGWKWHNGACCEVRGPRTYVCPKKDCKPWMGPGCRDGRA